MGIFLRATVSLLTEIGIAMYFYQTESKAAAFPKVESYKEFSQSQDRAKMSAMTLNIW